MYIASGRVDVSSGDGFIFMASGWPGKGHGTLLENSFASGPDFRSGVERAVLGRFQPDSGPLIGQAATFATGSHLLSSSSNAPSACGHLAPFRCLSDILQRLA
jgi:hypothetical protein